MRKKNNILKEYLSISEIFKWIVEGTLFNNNCIQTITINEEVDSLLTSSAFKVEKNRDIIRKVIVNGEALLIGIEHQSAVDYSMPVRNLVYDALTYEYQVKKKYAEQIAVGEKYLRCRE